jgi:hypothetical protein
MVITPAEARQAARDYVLKKEAPSSEANVSVSDFGKLADGGYSVLVDMTIGSSQRKNRKRYRVKMDENGKVRSFVTRQK